MSQDAERELGGKQPEVVEPIEETDVVAEAVEDEVPLPPELIEGAGRERDEP